MGHQAEPWGSASKYWLELGLLSLGQPHTPAGKVGWAGGLEHPAALAPPEEGKGTSAAGIASAGRPL